MEVGLKPDWHNGNRILTLSENGPLKGDYAVIATTLQEIISGGFSNSDTFINIKRKGKTSWYGQYCFWYRSSNDVPIYYY